MSLPPSLGRLAAAFVTLALSSNALAQCVELGPVQNWTGAGTTTCPCFVQNEEAAAIFSQIPASEFPIRITKIGIGWGSQFGGGLPAVEDSLNIYAGIPTGSASPLYSLGAPQLTDGFINEFDVEAAGNYVVNSSPFTISLRFFNDVNQPPYPPSIVHDGNGCQPGKNRVKVVSGLPAGWYDACALGVSGDWQIHVKYKRVNCGGGGSAGTSYCFGDGTGAVCPCDPGQTGQPGQGCAHSFGTGGALAASGNPAVSNDTIVLQATSLPPTTTALFFQGNNKQNGGLGSAFGDGLLCVNGNVIRLGSKVTSGGAADFGFGIGADPLVSVRGQVPATGATRRYQAWFRNSANFCTASTFNLSNGLELVWAP